MSICLDESCNVWLRCCSESWLKCLVMWVILFNEHLTSFTLCTKCICWLLHSFILINTRTELRRSLVIGIRTQPQPGPFQDVHGRGAEGAERWRNAGIEHFRQPSVSSLNTESFMEKIGEVKACMAHNIHTDDGIVMSMRVFKRSLTIYIEYLQIELTR